MSDAQWYEVRLLKSAELYEFYESIQADETIETFHHFWNEPWWPGAYVVRVRAHNADHLKRAVGADHIVPWDVSDDEAFFRDLWPHVMRFFEHSSAIAASNDPDLKRDAMLEKLIHCLLNAHGMDVPDERRWARSFLWGRMTIKLRWRLYGRRRWERARREAQPKAAVLIPTGKELVEAADCGMRVEDYIKAKALREESV